MEPGTLSGSRILIVEDEYYLADDARSTMSRVGADVVGPVPTVDEAKALLDDDGKIDGALLDVNLRGEMVYAVADVLQERGVPFVFVTGYDRGALPDRFADTPTLMKPVDGEQLVELFQELTSTRDAERVTAQVQRPSSAS